MAEIFGSSILLSGSQRHDVVWHRNAKLPIPKEATGDLVYLKKNRYSRKVLVVSFFFGGQTPYIN